METELGLALPSGWLLNGLRQTKRDTDDNPELRERVRRHPSGLILSDDEVER